MRRIRRLSRKLVVLVLSLTLATGTISCGPPALGLQDYQRDLLFGVLGALADALLIQVATGDGGSGLDAPAPAGARGPDQFSVQVEDFFGAQFDDNFAATPMALDAAILAEGAGPIGFRAPVPLTYGTNGVRRAVNLRLVFVRTGPCDGTCTSFTIDTRCLEAGSSAPICFGGEAADCSDGRRWIQLPEICTTGDNVGGFIIVDLPLDGRGLMLPAPGPGDYLAFELNAVVTDAGSYRLVGAELYDADGIEPRNASIFSRPEDIPDACQTMTGSDFDGDMVPDDDTDVAGRNDTDDDDDGIPDGNEGDGGNDNDGDGDPDSLDIDSDNDGIVDLVEAQTSAGFVPPSGIDADDDGLDDAYDADQGGKALAPIDTDGDGTPDLLDLDTDGDLVPDRIEGHDANMDGQSDVAFTGNDMDTDGLDDAYDTVMRPMSGNSLGSNSPLQDTDGDGTPDWRDTDDDGDGTPTRDEDRNNDGDPTNDDSDGDGTPDYLDPDDDFDGDGVPDPDDADDDDDGIPDDEEGPGDDDGDGQPNSLDIDRDNDGIVDLVEAQPRGAGFIAPSGNDADKDGLDDAYDPDQGGTPLNPIDTDNDGTPDIDDLDSDNDTVPDATEGHDANMDGQPDSVPTGNDGDMDGLDDAYETVTRPQPGNSLGSKAPLQDTDNDGTPDWRDTDDDGDGIPTKGEDRNEDGDPTNDDSDMDGTPDYLDPDDDFDGDGVPDPDDADDDDDGIPDDVEGDGDDDGDGQPNSLDIDRDNDGIPDLIEAQPRGDGFIAPSGNDADEDGLDDAYDPDQGGTAIVPIDTDNDGTPDVSDLDSDNDTVPDATEGHDANMDGQPDNAPTGKDADMDGLDDAYDTVTRPQPGNSAGSNAALQDTDNDGTPDWRDTDDDGDGTPTEDEDRDNDGDPTNDDDDGDGTPDYLDPDDDFDGDGVPDPDDADDDDDGIPDDVEGDGDDDGDGQPNSLDIDRDNDGIPDLIEAQVRGEGFIAPSGDDADEDGLDDAYDPDQGGTAIVPIDTDNDGTPDVADLDSDNDTVPDATEGHDANMDGQPDSVPTGNDGDEDGLDDAYDTITRPQPGNSAGSNAPLQDTDNDGTPDWRDTDDDGDGTPTRMEDRNLDGDPTNDDNDGDGTPDYLDPDDDFDGDGVPDPDDADDDDDGIPDDEEGLGDDDGDGHPNSLDIDRDNDGIPDLIEAQVRGEGFIMPSRRDDDQDGLDDAYDPDQGGTAIVPIDTDNDGTPDVSDLDSDNDTVPDSTEGHDANMDGQPDRVPFDLDFDMDGLDNAYDTITRPQPGNSAGSNAPLQDTDNDGTPDWRDVDDDGDGTPTEDEDRDGDGDPTNDDTDMDGTPDYLDPDNDFDGDGVPDPDDADDDDDGIPDVVEGEGDDDGDGQPNSLDIDRDGDGIVDLVEAQAHGAGFIAPSGNDADEDGLDDAYDPSEGGTSIVPIDTDNDGTPDVDDLDSDNDTVPDSTEGHDANMDGQPDNVPSGNDADMDGLDNAYDTITRPQPGNSAGSNAPLQDTDNDGTPDWRDTDDDGDGIPTEDEDADGDGDPTNDDTDDDGTPDYLDPGNDCNHNGVEDSIDIENGTEQDCNENGIPDSCDIMDGTSDDDNDNGVPDECEMMGACCFDDDTCVSVCEFVCESKLGGQFLGAGTECAGNKGLLATYYDNQDFTGDQVTRVDDQIDFNWGNGSPDPAIDDDSFSAIWEGYLLPPASGLYTLYITNDDGMRLYVNGDLLIDRWQNQSAQETSAEVMLTGGTPQELRVEYYEDGGSAVAELRWSSDQFGKEIIPSSALSNNEIGFCPFSVGACCMPDNTCEILPTQLCLDADGVYLGNGTACEEPPPWRTESGTYALGNGPSYTQGGMVLYGFLDSSGATWFDFDAEGAAMFLTYDASADTVRVSGYAAATVSGVSGFAAIDMFYENVQQVSGELRVTTPNGTNHGTVLWLPTREVANLSDKQLSGMTFRLYDAGGYDKGTGWFNHAGGSGDFHFEAERDPFCQPDPVGACCLDDGTCAVVTEWLCVDELHGTYAGDGTTCDDACAPACDDLLEDFEDGDGGWTCENASNCGIEEDMGNPGDSYGGCDDNGETSIIAGPKFLGDLTEHDGGTFGFDLLMFKAEEVEGRMGQIHIETSAGTFVQDIIPDGYVPPVREYRNFTGNFTAAAFGTSQSTWEAGLANVTEIRIVIEPGWDCWCVDNVLLTCPAP